MIDIGFLGYGTRALDALMADDRFRVRYFFAPRPRLCQDVYDAAEKYANRVSLEIIDNKSMLAERFKEITDVSCFLMNACPFILNEAVLSHMDVYNIHPGSLKTNRGHHPHLWTVLLGERHTSICLHKVNTQVDLGDVIEEVEIELTGREDALQVLNLAEDRIPQLLDGLYDYLTGGRGIKYSIEEGIYRPIMDYEDYRLTEQDDLDLADRKIRARAAHSGAFFVYEGKRIYVDKVLALLPQAENGLGDEGTACFNLKDGAVRFRVSKVTDLKGNILPAGGNDEINKD